MTISDLKERNLIIFECISGSRAQGLATSNSDTDIKGVYILPKEEFYGLEYVPQVNNESNDIVYYELRRFIELLSVNNPNILELLNTPKESVLYKHPVMDMIKPELFISKICKDSFGKFAYSQIKKAKGLKKKIFNPIDKKRKSALEFCYITTGTKSQPLEQFLLKNNWNQENCGLAKIDHMKDLYALYHNAGLNYKGILNSNANEVCLSSIPKGEKEIGILYFNRNSYSTYCKDYKEYWEWVEKRNDERFKNTLKHNKNYDAKNMMHVFRLLDMAIEIGSEDNFSVKRPNRDFLLKVKSGEFEYDYLMKLAEKKRAEMEKAFSNSNLPSYPDLYLINDVLFRMRDGYYSS